MINLPSLIIPQCVSDGAAIVAAVHRHVMLIAVLANVLEKRLEAVDAGTTPYPPKLSTRSAVISPSPQ